MAAENVDTSDQPWIHWSDGHCTGFPDGLFGLDWTHCCIEHDMGGTDGRLIDCISNAVPSWAEAIVVLLVGLAVILRPIYVELHRLGLAK